MLTILSNATSTAAATTTAALTAPMATPCSGCSGHSAAEDQYNADTEKLMHRISLYYTLGTVLVMALLFGFFIKLARR